MILVDIIKFRWKYLFARFLSIFFSKTTKASSYLFIVHDESKNWILGSKARRLQANCQLPGTVVYSKRFKNLPDAQGYFFLHQKYLARALRYNPSLYKRKLIVMYTHTEWNDWYSSAHFTYVLKHANKIVCLNSGVYDELLKMGIAKDKVEMYHMASDPNMFRAKDRSGNGLVGFSMAYGPRKNPEVVAKIIKLMPHRNFLLIGPRWQEFLEQNNIFCLPNFKYIDDLEYEKYPDYYQLMDILVSPSTLEGGPVPILEAMLSNVVPVASRTGFCPDLIEDGKNGFLFDTNATAEEIVVLIEKAFQLKYNVRDGIEKHSWENYGKKIGNLFQEIII